MNGHSGYLVSAIISVYKCEKFIAGRLDDLLAQTLGERLEIVIVDSNSPENERAIIEKYRTQHTNIKYIRTGFTETIYQAWNRGIRASSGEYIVNTNADDRLRPDALEVMARELEFHPEAALVYADYFITNTDNSTFNDHIRTGASLKPDYAPDIMLTGCHMGPQPLWRRSVHDEIGWFDEHLVSSGDYEFWCRLACRCPLRHISDFLGLYLHNPGGMVNRKLQLSIDETAAIKQKYAAQLPTPARRIRPDMFFLQPVPPGKFANIGMVTFNRLDFTQQALAALAAHTCYPHVVTVVDNGSTDGTREFLQQAQHRGIIKNLVLLDENLGVAKASNIAWLMEPTAQYYIKFDNDIVINDHSWLTRLAAAADNIARAGTLGYNFEPRSYPRRRMRGHWVRIKKNGSLGGACILVPARTRDAVGYWSEEYGPYGEEDADYGCRVRRAGLQNIYMDDENIGVHLPAGKAAAIDRATWQARDGQEEIADAGYRAWKDQQRRENLEQGLFRENLRKYQCHEKPLFIEPSWAQQYMAGNFPDKKTTLRHVPVILGWWDRLLVRLGY